VSSFFGGAKFRTHLAHKSVLCLSNANASSVSFYSGILAGRRSARPYTPTVCVEDCESELDVGLAAEGSAGEAVNLFDITDGTSPRAITNTNTICPTK